MKARKAKGWDEGEKGFTGEPAFAPGELERLPPAPKNTEGRVGLRGHQTSRLLKGWRRCSNDPKEEFEIHFLSSSSILPLAAVSHFLPTIIGILSLNCRASNIVSSIAHSCLWEHPSLRIMASVSSLDKDMKNIRLSKYTPQAANEVRAWIESVSGERLKAGDLLEALKDGTILCKYVPSLQSY